MSLAKEDQQMGEKGQPAMWVNNLSRYIQCPLQRGSNKCKTGSAANQY